MATLTAGQIQRAMLRRLVGRPRTVLPTDSSVDTDGLFDFRTDHHAAETSKTISIVSTVPVLEVYSANKWLKKHELQKISPNLELKRVYNGRYSANMNHNSHYYLEFHSVQDANDYMNQYPSEATRTLNGLVLSPHVCNDNLVNILRFLFHPMLPDISDLPSLIHHCRNSHSVDLSQYTQELQDSILKKRIDINKSLELLFGRAKSRTFSNPKVREVYTGMIDKLQQDTTSGSSEERINNVFPTFDRSNCVIVKNVPFKLSRHRFKQFLWDLEWFTPNPDFENVRSVFVDKSTALRTWVLIFKDSQNALECVSRMDAMHLFYQPTLPVVEAEIL